MVAFLDVGGQRGSPPCCGRCTVTDPELDRQRKLLHEAFVAGWQAALAVKVTSPSVLAVIESCFELWLEEEVDERGVLGLPFKRRYDLPPPKRGRAAVARSRPQEPSPETRPAAPRRTRARPLLVEAGPPAQRSSPENESSEDAGALRAGS